MSDVDVALQGNVRRFGRQLARRLGGRFTFHSEFGTGTVQLAAGEHVDLARTRTEIYERPAALPRVSPSNLEGDLKRRDFTINAMAWDLIERRLIDPFDGYQDLRRRTIRVLHELSFSDDPTRIFRAVRFSVRLGFRVAPESGRLMQQAIARGMLNRLSSKRILTELHLTLKEPRWLPMLRELNQRGVFASLFGRALTGEDLRALHRLAGTAPGQRLTYLRSRLGCYPLPTSLGQEEGRGCTGGTVQGKLPMTRAERADLTSLESFSGLRGRLRRADRPSAIYSLLQPLTDNALAIAQLLEPRPIARKIERFRREYAQVVRLVHGDDLKALGIPPGPIYAKLLKQLRAARLDGIVRTRNEELALARRLV